MKIEFSPQIFKVRLCLFIRWFSIRVLPLSENWNLKKQRFLSFKTRATRERTVTWWNPAAQTRPGLDSYSLAPVITLPHRTGLNSASSVLAVRISCRIIAVVVFRKPLIINYTLSYLYMLREYNIIYSVRYYPRFHVTAVGLGTYYPWIRRHTCIPQISNCMKIDPRRTGVFSLLTDRHCETNSVVWQLCERGK
jgi:hypothetical protein